MTTRTARIDQQLRQEIGEILARDIQDPRIGFVTVTEVDTAPDLSTARVWVSVIGQPAERDQTVRALQRAMPFVRHELGGRLHLRRIPELQVRVDDTAERGTRVLQLLAELEAGEAPALDAPPVTAESLPTPMPRLPHEGDAPEPEAPEPPSDVSDAAGPASRRRGREQHGSRGGTPRSGSGSPRGGTSHGGTSRRGAQKKRS